MMTSSLAQICVGKQWVRGRGGRLKWGDCTSAADCGKIQQVFRSTAIPLSFPSSAARAIDKGGYKKPDPFISQYSPFHRRQFFPRHVTQSLRYLSPTHCPYSAGVFLYWISSCPPAPHIVSSSCRANTLCRVPSQCED